VLVDICRKDKSWEVRDAARLALLRCGKLVAKEVARQMPGTVRSPKDDVARTAVELCGAFGLRDALRSLGKIILYDKVDTRRMFAARALERITGQELPSFLNVKVSRRKKTPRTVELNVVRALGYMRTDAAFIRLLDILALEGASEPLLAEVETALERQTHHRFGRKVAIWRRWRASTSEPFGRARASFKRSTRRQAVVEKQLYGVSVESEAAVERGLRWLDARQGVLGAWIGRKGDPEAYEDCEPAYTGLALLTFLGAGYGGAGGKFSEAVRRGREFLTSTQLWDGSFADRLLGAAAWVSSYVDGMATWALVESYAQTTSAALGATAQWGIDHISKIQTPGGGWRYAPRSVRSDSSCTSWMLMALKGAEVVGLDVPQRCWDGADRWLEQCTSPLEGLVEHMDDITSDYDYEVGLGVKRPVVVTYFQFDSPEQKSLNEPVPSITAAGMVCRLFMGWGRSHPALVGGSITLERTPPKWEEMSRTPPDSCVYHYFWYYGSLAAFQMGGRHWRTWQSRAYPMYIKHQRMAPTALRGSWDPDPGVLSGGRLFSTCMSVMSLETPYRFSPLMMHGRREAKPPK